MRSMRRHGVAWFELLLVLAVVALLFQLFPAAWSWLVGALDPRSWSRQTWFLANLAVVLVLLSIRLAPEMKAVFARRKVEATKRKQREERKRLAEERSERRLRPPRIT